MLDRFIIVDKDGCCCRIDYRAFEQFAGELLDCLQGLPPRKNEELNFLADAPLAQLRSQEPVTASQLRNHFTVKMSGVLLQPSFSRSRPPFTNYHDGVPPRYAVPQS